MTMAAQPAAILLFLLLHLVLLLDLASTTADGRQQVLLQERATLLAFRRGLKLRSSSDLADWNESNGDVCRFTGVSCDRRREHVVGLALADMNISGAVPAVLGELVHLRSLDMSNNRISGGLPLFLGNLTRLWNLSMSGNHISGGIPPFIGNLTNLNYLDMSGNRLTGQIPAELSHLHNLEALQLDNNQLRGGIPPSLAKLTNMFYLSLWRNYLSGPIPEALFLNCTTLAVIDLCDNDLSGQIPRTASGALTGTFAFLNLYSNKLTGTLPRWLANCTYLVLLDVEGNSIADELPTGIISGKQHLEYLHLSDNRFWSHDGNSNMEPFLAALANCLSLLQVEVANVGIGGQLALGT